MCPIDRKQEIEQKLRQVLTAQGLRAPSYAIVLPVEIGPDGVHLLIEVRAAGISQAGDPCFPGGKVERGETPAEAAAREMGEELAIFADPSRFLGRLPTVQTYLGRSTDVFVCTVMPEEAAGVRVNPSEVAALLRVPLSYFLEDPHAADYPWDGHVIWGMTAGAIRHFCAAWKRAGLDGAEL